MTVILQDPFTVSKFRACKYRDDHQTNQIGQNNEAKGVLFTLPLPRNNTNQRFPFRVYKSLKHVYSFKILKKLNYFTKTRFLYPRQKKTNMTRIINRFSLIIPIISMEKYAKTNFKAEMSPECCFDHSLARF